MHKIHSTIVIFNLQWNYVRMCTLPPTKYSNMCTFKWNDQITLDKILLAITFAFARSCTSTSIREKFNLISLGNMWNEKYSKCSYFIINIVCCVVGERSFGCAQLKWSHEFNMRSEVNFLEFEHVLHLPEFDITFPSDICTWGNRI